MPLTRLGVAGLGWLGESLVKEALAMSDFEVAAVQDLVVDREREIAERYNVLGCSGSFESLLQAEVDAIIICTPNGSHAAQAQAALRAGKDVLVQKPLALTFGDAAQTIEVATDTDRLLFIDYTYRFLDTMDVLRRNVGGIRSMRAAFHNIYGPGAEKRWFLIPPNPAAARSRTSVCTCWTWGYG